MYLNILIRYFTNNKLTDSSIPEYNNNNDTRSSSALLKSQTFVKFK